MMRTHWAVVEGRGGSVGQGTRDEVEGHSVPLCDSHRDSQQLVQAQSCLVSATLARGLTSLPMGDLVEGSEAE
jgi:hypothetical protein